MKTQIDQAKEKVLELKGKLNYVLTDLKTQWGCSSTEEANKKLDDMNKKKAKLEQTIEEGLQDLEEKYYAD